MAAATILNVCKCPIIDPGDVHGRVIPIYRGFRGCRVDFWCYNFIHVNPERSFGGTNGEPPSEASELRKGGPGVVPRKISKTYMANGAIYVIPELYL